MIDLHTHSTFSDGSCSPTELVQLAKNIGLSAIALTDHNTISGLEEFEKAGKKYDIETISSIEISTETNDEDFHIIALFIKQDHYNAIEAYLKCAIDSKIESNKLLVKNLNRSGYNISYDQIVKENGSENFNRVAIANKLMEKGYVQSIKEAFNGLLHEKTGYYIPPKRLDTYETIKSSLLHKLNFPSGLITICLNGNIHDISSVVEFFLFGAFPPLENNTSFCFLITIFVLDL